MTNKLYEWFDRLPEEACVFTARGGREMHTFLDVASLPFWKKKNTHHLPKIK